MAPHAWPLVGLKTFATHPAWWFRPLATTLAGWLVMLAAVVAVAWWRWPAGDLGWWQRLLGISLALGWGVLTALAYWLLLAPILMGLAMEGLARQVQTAAGAPPLAEERITAAVASSLRVILGTLPFRLGWLALGVIGVFTGPFAAVIGAVGTAHVASLDAFDIALSVRGIPGVERLRLIREHREHTRGGAVVGGGLNLALGLSLVLWPFWLPGLVAGAARAVLDWPEVHPQPLDPQPLRATAPPAIPE